METEPPLPPPLESVYFCWSVLVLVSSLVLNMVTFLLVLRGASSCHRDPVTPALLSVLGSQLMEAVMVQVFRVHQQYMGHNFLASDNLCLMFQANQAIISEVPFSTISLQLVITLQSLKKDREVYTYFQVCCGSLMSVLMPWLLAGLALLASSSSNSVQAGLKDGHCEPVVAPPSVWQYSLQQCLVIGLPLLLVLLLVLSSLPLFCSCRGPFTCTCFSAISCDLGIKEDTTLLSVLLVAHLLFQCPTRGVQGILWYSSMLDRVEPVMRLMVRIARDLPLIINPVGILVFRVARRGRGFKGDTQDHVHINGRVAAASPSEENINMIISMDGKELETALFESKTTNL